MRRTVAGLLEASFFNKLWEKRPWSHELGRGVWGARVGGRTRRLLGFDCRSLWQISPSPTVWEMGDGNPFLWAMALRRYRPRSALFRLRRPPPLAGAACGARILDVLPYLTSCEWFSVGSGRPGSSRSEKPHVKVIQKRMSWICCGIIVHSMANMATTLLGGQRSRAVVARRRSTCGFAA